MFKKMLLLFIATLIFVGISVKFSFGKEFPTKPIEIYVGYTPGSTTDLIGRMIADIAPKYLGGTFVIVNKPGAGGSLAAAEVVNSKPDGYKIYSSSNSFFALTSKTQKLKFDPSHLVPLASYLDHKSGIMVKADSPWKTFNDLLDYGRKNPGKLRYGHTGRGHPTHIYGLLVFKKAGIETIDVPYVGALDKLTALLGGHIDAAGEPYATVKEHVKAGKVRYLVLINDQRYSDVPDIPCAAELGFPEAAKVKSIFGVYIHKNTPQDIMKTLIDAMKKTIEDPEFKRRMENFAGTSIYLGPEPSKKIVEESIEVSVPILKELGLYVGK